MDGKGLSCREVPVDESLDKLGADSLGVLEMAGLVASVALESKFVMCSTRRGGYKDTRLCTGDSSATAISIAMIFSSVP